jgi:hypothetical protein
VTRADMRWIVLGCDGRHVTLGRHTDPSAEEIERAAQALRATGMGGWLAVTEGTYYGHGRLSVMMVRELVPPERSWEEALAAFHETRSRATLSPEP